MKKLPAIAKGQRSTSYWFHHASETIEIARPNDAVTNDGGRLLLHEGKNRVSKQMKLSQKCALLVKSAYPLSKNEPVSLPKLLCWMMATARANDRERWKGEPDQQVERRSSPTLQEGQSQFSNQE